MNKSNILTIISIILVAVLGTIFTNLGMSWYSTLGKPSQWIPSFIIPIMWTIIYLLFALILYLWQQKEKLTTKIISLLVINGILNVLWCLVFFTLKSLFIGNVIIVINTVLALNLIYEICKEKPIYAAWLYIYPLWLCVATTLNLAVWILN